MTALPRELTGARALLGLFAPEVAADLSPWVRRLALAVGPMRASLPVAGGEPDGFTGIARRGSYERLLLTEWLLADEAPEEFTRRAATGEHAFHEPARRSPAVSRSSVVLFDGGPEQLGAPRIVHLAALIVLAERAAAARARFAWGILHEPEGALLEGVTRESIGRLLAARSPSSVGDEEVAAWIQRARRSGWDDAWIVGSRGACRGWAHGVVEAREVLEPERRAVVVIVRPRGAASRELELELPETRACARLLRDPFAVATPPPRRSPSAVAPASNLLFAPNATKLFARTAGGEIVGYPVPNSIYDQVGRPKRYRAPFLAQGVVGAVGWVKRGLVMLTMSERELRLDHTNRGGPNILRSVRPRPPELPIPKLEEALGPLLCLGLDDRAQIFFVDGKGAPWVIAGGELRRIADAVAAIGWSKERVILVAGHDCERDEYGLDRRVLAPGAIPELEPGWQLVAVGGAGREGSIQRLVGKGQFRACLGYSESGPSAGGLVAIEQRTRLWTIYDDGLAKIGEHEVLDLDADRVVGVWRSGPSSAPELLVIEDDRRTVSLVGPTSRRSLPRAAAPIEHFAGCTTRSIVAFSTAEREVVIQSLLHDAPLARFQPVEGR